MLTFAYMVGGWVQQDAYVIKKKKKETRKNKKNGKLKKTVENIAIKYSRNKK